MHHNRRDLRWIHRCRSPDASLHRDYRLAIAHPHFRRRSRHPDVHNSRRHIRRMHNRLTCAKDRRRKRRRTHRRTLARRQTAPSMRHPTIARRQIHRYSGRCQTSGRLRSSARRPHHLSGATRRRLHESCCCANGPRRPRETRLRVSLRRGTRHRVTCRRRTRLNTQTRTVRPATLFSAR
jgi:hypothetical protein